MEQVGLSLPHSYNYQRTRLVSTTVIKRFLTLNNTALHFDLFLLVRDWILFVMINPETP